jgi:hypothetical protein
MWHMRANIGPAKSALMLFAPKRAKKPLLTGVILWNGEPLVVVEKYK